MGKKQNWKNWTLGKMFFWKLELGEMQIWKNGNLENGNLENGNFEK